MELIRDTFTDVIEAAGLKGNYGIDIPQNEPEVCDCDKHHDHARRVRYGTRELPDVDVQAVPDGGCSLDF